MSDWGEREKVRECPHLSNAVLPNTSWSYPLTLTLDEVSLYSTIHFKNVLFYNRSFLNSAHHSSYLWTPFKQFTLNKLTEQVLFLVTVTSNCQWMILFTKKCSCYWTEGLCGKSSTKCGTLTFARLMTLATWKSNMKIHNKNRYYSSSTYLLLQIMVYLL